MSFLEDFDPDEAKERDFERNHYCEKCDGDGYIEEFNKDQSGVITEICPDCKGSGQL